MFKQELKILTRDQNFNSNSNSKFHTQTGIVLTQTQNFYQMIQPAQMIELPQINQSVN